MTLRQYINCLILKIMILKCLIYNCDLTPSETEYCTYIHTFNVHGSVHRESMSIIVQQDTTKYSLSYFCKLLYMFPVVTPPIIRSTYKCTYSIWHWSNRLCYLPLWWRVWNCCSSSNLVVVVVPFIELSLMCVTIKMIYYN